MHALTHNTENFIETAAFHWQPLKYDIQQNFQYFPKNYAAVLSELITRNTSVTHL